jgi:hypothetical protein
MGRARNEERDSFDRRKSAKAAANDGGASGAVDADEEDMFAQAGIAAEQEWTR